MRTWYILENKNEYKSACNRNEQVTPAHKGSEEHKEKLLLALLINQYQEKQSTLPQVDPIELIKIRMEGF